MEGSLKGGEESHRRRNSLGDLARRFSLKAATKGRRGGKE